MKSMKRIVCTTLALVLVAAVMMAGLTVSAADSYKNYKEFKGSVAVLTNCNGTGTGGSFAPEGQNGKIDTFGIKGGTTSAEVEGGKEKDGWTMGKASEEVSYSTEHFLEGKSSVKIHVTPDQTMTAGKSTGLYVTKTRFVIRNMTNIKITDKNKTYLCFYLYCNSVDDLKQIDWGSSCIEISDVSDSTEYSFSMNQINENNIDPATGKKVLLDKGWNRVVLPLSKASGVGFTNLKMFRFYLFAGDNMPSNKSVDVYFDNITLETADALGIKTNTSSATPSSTGVPSKTSSTSSTASTTGVPEASSTIGETSSAAATTSEISGTTEDPAEVNESSDIPADAETEAEEESGSTWWVWVVVVVVLLAAVGAALYFLVFAKKKA